MRRYTQKLRRSVALGILRLAARRIWTAGVGLWTAAIGSIADCGGQRPSVGTAQAD